MFKKIISFPLDLLAFIFILVVGVPILLVIGLSVSFSYMIIWSLQRFGMVKR